VIHSNPQRVSLSIYFLHLALALENHEDSRISWQGSEAKHLGKRKACDFDLGKMRTLWHSPLHVRGVEVAYSREVSLEALVSKYDASPLTFDPAAFVHYSLVSGKFPL